MITIIAIILVSTGVVWCLRGFLMIGWALVEIIRQLFWGTD